MTGILGQLKWESLKKGERVIYKGLKGKARIPTDDRIPILCAAEISTLWPFTYPLLVKTPMKIASFLELSGIGMTSLISSAELSDDCMSKFNSLVRARD